MEASAMLSGFMHDLRIWIEWHGSALTAIASAAMAVALSVGVVFACVYAWQVRRAAYTRRLLTLLHQYHSSSMVSVRAAWLKKRANNEPAMEEMRALMDFFGSVGFAVKRGFVRAEDVWESLGLTMLTFYSDAKPSLPDFQQFAPEACEHFICLMERMQQIKQSHGGPAAVSQINGAVEQRGSATTRS
jgi:hypothetical protein